MGYPNTADEHMRDILQGVYTEASELHNALHMELGDDLPSLWSNPTYTDHDLISVYEQEHGANSLTGLAPCKQDYIIDQMIENGENIKPVRSVYLISFELYTSLCSVADVMVMAANGVYFWARDELPSVPLSHNRDLARVASNEAHMAQRLEEAQKAIYVAREAIPDIKDGQDLTTLFYDLGLANKHFAQLHQILEQANPPAAFVERMRVQRKAIKAAFYSGKYRT